MEIQHYSSTDSTSTTTGALQVAGGIGIAKSLYAPNFVVDATVSGAPRPVSGWGINITSKIVTDSTTAASSTTPYNWFNYIYAPTLSASNTAVTTTNSATLLIQGPPNAGTNMTITNPWALWVANGNVTIQTITDSSSATTGALQVSGGVGIAKSLTVSGSTRFATAYYLTMYTNGVTPTLYNYSGTAMGTTVSTVTYYYYGILNGNTNQNFAPNVVSNIKFYVPVNGIYYIRLLCHSSSADSTAKYDCFIAKNATGNDLNSSTDSMIAAGGSNTVNTTEMNISGVAALTTTDSLSFGFFLSGGTFVTGARTLLTIYCMQRTS